MYSCLRTGMSFAHSLAACYLTFSIDSLLVENALVTYVSAEAEPILRHIAKQWTGATGAAYTQLLRHWHVLRAVPGSMLPHLQHGQPHC